MTDRPRLFPNIDVAAARATHQWMNPPGSIPIPVSPKEWVKVSEALLAAGMHDLQDALNRRRTALLNDLSTLTRVAVEVRDRNDPRKICSADVRLGVHATVVFSGHGSFAPDGDVREMVKDFNHEKAYRALPGIGDLNERVAARSEVYCG